MNSRLRGSFFYLSSPLWGKSKVWKCADYEVSDDFRLLYWTHKENGTIVQKGNFNLIKTDEFGYDGAFAEDPVHKTVMLIPNLQLRHFMLLRRGCKSVKIAFTTDIDALNFLDCMKEANELAIASESGNYKKILKTKKRRALFTMTTRAGAHIIPPGYEETKIPL